MKIERPQFELTRVYAQGTKESPEIIFVSRMVWDTRMARRGFLGLGIGIASVLLSGCEQFNGILVAHSGPVNALAVSLDGKTLASGSDDNTIKLWSLPDGKLLATLEGHKNRVNALAISPDGKTLASGSDDTTVKLWSLPDGKLLATLEEHKDRVNALVISPDGKTLVSGSGYVGESDSIKLWSLPDGKPLATLKGLKSSATPTSGEPGAARACRSFGTIDDGRVGR